jgi:hypothetical protein
MALRAIPECPQWCATQRKQIKKLFLELQISRFEPAELSSQKHGAY